MSELADALSRDTGGSTAEEFASLVAAAIAEGRLDVVAARLSPDAVADIAYIARVGALPAHGNIDGWRVEMVQGIDRPVGAVLVFSAGSHGAGMVVDMDRDLGIWRIVSVRGAMPVPAR